MKYTKDQVFFLVTLNMLRNSLNPSLLDLIDLKDYYLEYESVFTNINETYKSYGDACITIAAKLLDKKTNKYVWGDYFHKVIDKNISVNTIDGVLILAMEYFNLVTSSIETQMNFVLRNEKRIGYAPYLSDNFIVLEGNRLYNYFKNVNSKTDNDSYIVGGKIPEKAKEDINLFYHRYVANLDYDPNKINPKLLKKLF